MKRYNVDLVGESENGLWIRYEDHCEAMKHIAGEGAQQARDSVTREQVIEWGRLAGFDTSLTRERNLERLADFAIFARRAAAPTPTASPAALTDEAFNAWSDEKCLSISQHKLYKRGYDFARALLAASPADQAEKPDAFAVFRTGFKTTRVCGPDSLYEISVKYRNIDDLHAADDELRAAMSATPPAAE